MNIDLDSSSTLVSDGLDLDASVAKLQFSWSYQRRESIPYPMLNLFEPERIAVLRLHVRQCARFTRGQRDVPDRRNQHEREPRVKHIGAPVVRPQEIQRRQHHAGSDNPE